MKPSSKSLILGENFFETRKTWILFGLTLIACGTRLTGLENLPGTTWDEVHFGKFAGLYINRTFHHDVHPPLGKIILAGAAYLTGYRGNFNFSVANYYDETVNYVLIRAQMGFMGALLVPLTFLTVYELTSSSSASLISSIGVLCDTLIHKLTTLYLLDPPLLLAICFAVFSTIKFWKQREWSLSWWFWLFMTGCGLGVVISIKYVGVFTVLFVGLHTAFQLYSIAATKDRSVVDLIPHTLARIIFLIFLPIAVYLGSFVLHFAILTQTNPGEGAWIHSRFYAALNNSDFDRSFSEYVTYGSKITLQSSSMSGYLDSWFELFPSEFTAPCQLVSTRPLKQEDGHVWQIRHVDISHGAIDDGNHPLHPPHLVRNGDYLMLTHQETGRSLRAHGYRAPITKRLLQVCGYGDDGQGGPGETWQILIPGVPMGEPLKTFAHDFQLLNYNRECYLKSSQVPLPISWSSGTVKEVACTRNPNHSNLLWHIHWIDTDKWAGQTRAQNHTMGIWEKIVHLHEIMFTINSNLKDTTSAVDQDVPFVSPWHWPISYKGQLMAGYSSNRTADEYDIFSVGLFNPYIAYMNVMSFFLLFVLYVYHFYTTARHPEENEEITSRRHDVLVSVTWMLFCWGFHYLPFFAMSRVLYLHHYCPAFIYSCMITGITLDYYFEVWSRILQTKHGVYSKNILVLLYSSLIFISYGLLYPLATHIHGEIFSENTDLHSVLEFLNLGQPWYEFGFQAEKATGFSLKTEMDPIEEYNFENPFINTTLYYTMNLDTDMSLNATLSPASVFQNLSKQFL